MSKGTKNIIIIVAITLLVFAILFAVYGHFKTEPMNANTSKENVLGDANTGLENLLGNIFNEENVVKNENTTGNNEETNKETNINQDNKNETTNSAQENNLTPKETKAIELAKKQWIDEMGSTNNVSFSVSIQNDGKYGVTIYDTTTTRTIQFYIVDVDNETVKER